MLNHLSNEALISRLKSLVLQERTALVALLAHLAEFDERKLYADMRYPSLFAYCVRELGYSEQATAKRVYTARAAQKYPVILAMIEKTELNMAAVMVLGPHLTPGNNLELLSRARGKSSREVEVMVAALAPRREVAECIRHVSSPCVPKPTIAPSPAIVPDPAIPPGPIGELHPTVAPEPDIKPLILTAGTTRETRQAVEFFAPQRVHFGFNGSADFLAKYERARELLRHKYPAGKLEDILDDALEALLDKKDPDRKISTPKAMPARPSANTRTIPRFVRTAVWARDAGRCVFAGPDGTLCGERGGLEFDHITPYALGGRSDDPKNIRLLCRTHNQLMARRIFGAVADRPD